MAPAVGSTEMRYFGISLFRRLAKVTIALWPAVPTGGVPQRMSCWGQATEVVMPTKAATAMAVRTCVRVASPTRTAPLKSGAELHSLRRLGRSGERGAAQVAFMRTIPHPAPANLDLHQVRT